MTTPPDAPHADGPGVPPPSPPPPPSAADGPRVSGAEMRDLARLRRSRTDRKIAGVAGGLARHLDIDPVIVRVGLVVLTIFGGAGLLVYGALWLVVPEEGAPRAALNLDDGVRSAVIIVLLVLAALSLVGDSWGFWDFPWPLAVIGVVVLLLLSGRDRGRRRVDLTKQPPGGAASAGWPPPAAWQSGAIPSYAPPPPNPRKRGPVLFWFTLALSVLAVGLVGVVDVAGWDVPGAAYPAAVVAACGVMLLVGAFFGRAGGVIALGLLASLALAGAAAADQWEGDHTLEAPRTAAGVQDAYDLTLGEMVLDLSGVADPARLAGRTVEVSVDVGRVEVVLPAGIDVEVTAEVSGPGELTLPDRHADGADFRETGRFEATTGAAGAASGTLFLDVQVGVGELEVTR